MQRSNPTSHIYAWFIHNLLLPANKVAGEFSLVTVCPWGSYVTIIHDVLELTVQHPPPPAWTWDLRNPSPSCCRGDETSGTPMLMTSGGHHWRPVQICSIQDPLPQHPVAVEAGAVSVSGWYASYWNAFLFIAKITSPVTHDDCMLHVLCCIHTARHRDRYWCN